MWLARVMTFVMEEVIELGFGSLKLCALEGRGYEPLLE